MTIVLDKNYNNVYLNQKDDLSTIRQYGNFNLNNISSEYCNLNPYTRNIEDLTNKIKIICINQYYNFTQNYRMRNTKTHKYYVDNIHWDFKRYLKFEGFEYESVEFNYLSTIFLKSDLEKIGYEVDGLSLVKIKINTILYFVALPIIINFKLNGQIKHLYVIECVDSDGYCGYSLIPFFKFISNDSYQNYKNNLTAKQFDKYTIIGVDPQ